MKCPQGFHCPALGWLMREREQKEVIKLLTVGQHSWKQPKGRMRRHYRMNNFHHCLLTDRHKVHLFGNPLELLS